jgi:hypothetical protein
VKILFSLFLVIHYLIRFSEQKVLKFHNCENFDTQKWANPPIFASYNAQHNQHYDNFLVFKKIYIDKTSDFHDVFLQNYLQ